MATSGKRRDNSAHASASIDAAARTQQSERAQAKRFSEMLRQELAGLTEKLVAAEVRWHRRCESSGVHRSPRAHCPGPTTRDRTGRDDKSIGHPIPTHLIQPPRSVGGRGGGALLSDHDEIKALRFLVANCLNSLLARHRDGCARKQTRLTGGWLKTQITPRISAARAGRPTIPTLGPKGRNRKGKAVFGLNGRRRRRRHGRHRHLRRGCVRRRLRRRQ
jgi:hypothetical protein